jgi:HKD family nuclease
VARPAGRRQQQFSSFRLGVQPGRTDAISAFGEIARSTNWSLLVVSVAYATRTGARQLVAELSTQWDGWELARKVFAVGLDFGLTEPEALDYLSRLPNAECRVYRAETALAARLRPAHLYHPKVYAFADAPHFRRASVLGGVVGSGNLTGAGLRDNFECYMQFVVSTAAAQGRAWQEQLIFLEEALETEDPLTADLLARYRRLRPRTTWRPPATELLEAPDTSRGPLDDATMRALRTARCFWTQTLNIVPNLGRRRPGNQIDLKKGARAFFNSRVPMRRPLKTRLGTVPTVAANGAPPEICSMRYGDNGMDKVNLPIPGGQNPARYDHTHLLWERRPGGIFRLRVNARGRAWREASRRERTIFSYAGGQRDWGFFDAALPQG